MLAVLTAAFLGWVVVGNARADGSGPPAGGIPSISGTPDVGNALTADPGSWSGDQPITYSYAWSDGQTGETDTLSPADVGEYLTVTVTASNDAGQSSSTSDSYGPVQQAAPVNNGAPSITGTAQQGDTLTVSDSGTWSNDPSLGYAWEDCTDSTETSCSPITGATSSSYTLQASDVGSMVAAVVTGSNNGGQVAVASPTLGPVQPLPAPVNSVAPTITGGGNQPGDTLTVSNGTWSNGPALTFAWEDCDASGNNCSSITGATTDAYKLQGSDVGSTIVAVVTGSNDGGAVPAASTAYGPIVPPPPVNSGSPAITGTPQQGDTLLVSNVAWSNNPIVTYAWEDCSNSSGTNCSTIGGATSTTYTLQASDVGKYVIATVTGTNPGGHLSVSSAPTGQVLIAAPVDTIAPGIAGTAQEGATLTASAGAWEYSPTYKYAWEDCTNSAETSCSNIAGATSSTYTQQASDVNSYVSVTVTATNAGGTTTLTSAAVGPVLPPAPVNTKAPAITGTAEQDDTLSVSNGTWSNGPTLTYAWEECNSSGSSCSAINGATSNSYALSAADVGSTIVCVVTATGPGGSTSAKTSKTAVVAAAPIPVASQSTTINVLVTPSSPVTNQTVTLIATVTAGTSSTALWGGVTFENGGAAIAGCANMAVTPSGQSATVACSTSFAASSAQLSAVFIPTTGSILKGSSGSAGTLAIGPDSSSTSLDASGSVTVGTSTTYTATVTPPAARPGPIEPTGSVEFLDGGQPIGSCANQPLANGAATCAITYTSTGTHDISARYSGDANFSGSSSPTGQLDATAPATTVMGTISSTMQWQFYYTPKYTIVRALVVNGVSNGATVVVKCHGHGCPFASHAALLPTGKKCGKKGARMCSAGGSFNVTPGFSGRRLKVGAHITVSIMQPNWVGKTYSFTVRARRGPTIQIGCLAAGSANSPVGC
jgi:hypothetical protein